MVGSPRTNNQTVPKTKSAFVRQLYNNQAPLSSGINEKSLPSTCSAQSSVTQMFLELQENQLRGQSAVRPMQRDLLLQK